MSTIIDYSYTFVHFHHRKDVVQEEIRDWATIRRECWNKAHHKSVSRTDFCRWSLNLIRTPSRRVAQRACGGGKGESAQGVSWPATYLHPNIKPLRLVPIILDKQQDSMMYCRGICRAFSSWLGSNDLSRIRWELMRDAIAKVWHGYVYT